MALFYINFEYRKSIWKSDIKISGITRYTTGGIQSAGLFCHNVRIRTFPQEFSHGFTAGLIPLDTALTQMLNQITPLHDSESVPLLQAFGRITASDISSPLDVPGFDNSAMDGYAVRLADIAAQTLLAVAGKALPGSRSTVNGRQVPVFVL